MTPTEMTAVELVAAYGAKELSPVEATEAVLARMDQTSRRQTRKSTRSA